MVVAVVPVSITKTLGEDDFWGMRKTGPPTLMDKLIFVLFFKVSVAVFSIALTQVK